MQIITCPNCTSILDKVGKVYKCSNNHSFDVSKEGYINLLLANKKRNLNPGDNKSMINARESFLSQGYYDFLVQSIESLIQTNSSITKSDLSCFLDLGCGSGYYSRSILSSENYKKFGIDISKNAIAKAAKLDKKSTYIISSVFDLPLNDSSIDVVLNVFSPIDMSEVMRVLKPEGLLIKVIPGNNHMKEVAVKVYESFIPHQSTIVKELEDLEYLKVVETENVEKTIQLAGDDLRNCISMTPYVYKFDNEQLVKLEELSITLSFLVIIAQKK